MPTLFRDGALMKTARARTKSANETRVVGAREARGGAFSTTHG